MDDELARRALPPLDRLPAEIRIKIFALVLCPKGKTMHVAKRRTHAVKCYARLVDTAILVALVNDHHYGEACEIFYTSHFVSFSRYWHLYGLAEMRQSALYITRLKLVNFASGDIFLTKDCLEFAMELPKLKWLCVAFDGLSHTTTLREHLNKIGVLAGRKLVCRAVACYEIRHGKDKIISFQHRGMLKQWQDNKAKHAGSRSRRDVWRVEPSVDSWESDSWEWTTAYEWIAAFNITTRSASSFEGGTAYQLPWYLTDHDETIIKRESTKIVTAAITGDLGLLELDKDKSCTAEVLEGITDLLLINSGYCPLLGLGDDRYKAMQKAHRRSAESLTRIKSEEVDCSCMNWIRVGLDAMVKIAKRVFRRD
ncbi:hypothetical protein LTR56_024346 [Elasticomyces elasticus]|nr:hypothetical protein LTR56_024346 [Elasticomyces elasticus]KAK3623198.1 hypothetical protein LTR22_024497 [Elasticomyces elasticus]KAK4905746.1 hypothetical protein LTR49_024995 [Elasticomyces elasticus]KAK5743212.1 hypothetical protein LTS12_023941 [Elasticomyces elasticus]